jgi:glycosyltransferase involved in cell wall biosynthesis
MERSKQVLWLSYYAPPMGGSGVQRPVKFAKYLAKLGWTIHWVCPNEGAYPYRDEGLMQDLDSDKIQLHRVGGGTPQHSLFGSWIQSIYYALPASVAARLNSWFYFPDNKVGWAQDAVQTALELISTHHIPFIFVTAPPFSSFSLATTLAEQTGAKLVMDLRDDWLENQFHRYATASRRTQMAKLEQQVLSKADAITVINDSTRLRLAQRHPILSPRMSVIHNGFDPEDFVGMDDAQKQIDQSINELGTTNEPGTTPHTTPLPSRWLYNGLFYRQQDPSDVLKGFVRHAHEATAFPIQFIIQGDDGKRYRRVVQQAKDRFEWKGYLSHAASLKGVMQADVLWLHLSAMQHIDRVTPGKLFEYMGAGKPIFATIPEGVTAELLRQYGPVSIVHSTRPEEIATAVQLFEQQRQEGSLPPVNTSFVESFDRQRLTHSLEQIFLNLAPES